MSKHRGVFLLKPDKAQRQKWRMRWRDPDDGKTRKETLPDHMQGGTAKAAKLRTNECVKKLAEINKRKEALRDGAVAKSRTTIDDALTAYYEARIRTKSTGDTYAQGLTRFRDWARKNRIATLDDLRRSDLVRFRDRLAQDQNAPATINKKIRATKTFVAWAIDNDMCPKLHLDGLRRMKPVQEDVKVLEYHSPEDLQRILEAAARHDSDCFAMTRLEKGLGHKAGTPRHPSILPFTVLVMLSGARLSEAARLTWKDFDPDVLDESGNRVGEIRVPSSIAKLGRARAIGLGESPMLRQMLIARRLQTGAVGTLCGVTRTEAVRGMERMRKTYGSPYFTWQSLRQTTSTFLSSAPGIYGAAADHLSAKRLGHTPKVAQAHYAAGARGIARDAFTLEDAMKVKIPISVAGSAPVLHRRESSTSS